MARFFLNAKHRVMTKKVLITAVGFLMTLGIFAQKPQRIGYVDMEYILEHIPDYQNAQNQLSQKVLKWQNNIANLQGEIDQMKRDFSNEKALLTSDLIAERQEDITIKEDELRQLQNQYFGTDGDLFVLRQQLVKPIQDQVFNAIQEIATNRQYDFVLDKSSDLIMLYSNSKFDISDMVVKSITRSEKQKELDERKSKGKDTGIETEEKVLTEEQIQRQEELDAQKQVIEDQKTDRAKQREAQLKAIEEARQKKIQEREEARKKLEEKKAAEQKAREDKQQENQDQQ